ncbi:MAG: riboflavin synthase [Deltaproteobacteria bacterium]|nr:riboflavin synthase [Deltaproteobacteria bacterium]
MFTGLVQLVGTLGARRPGPQQQTLVIEARLEARDRVLGASVAINGVCLTVTESDADQFAVDAAFETLQRTTLGDLAVGAALNLEPALRVGDALGGHLVSGHVDGVGRVRSVEARGDAREIWVDVPPELMRFCAAKGSICIEGTSLTVNEIDAKGLSVGLVPHTLQATTLHALAAGAGVNLEVDQIARYVARLLDHRADVAAAPGLSVDDLLEAGYLDPGEGRR